MFNEDKMISTESIIKKLNKIKRIDDLVAINHYLDYLIYREKDKTTELGQSLIKGLDNIVNRKTYSINSSDDILKVADEI